MHRKVKKAGLENLPNFWSLKNDGFLQKNEKTIKISKKTKETIK